MIFLLSTSVARRITSSTEGTLASIERREELDLKFFEFFSGQGSEGVLLSFIVEAVFSEEILEFQLDHIVCTKILGHDRVLAVVVGPAVDDVMTFHARFASLLQTLLCSRLQLQSFPPHQTCYRVLSDILSGLRISSEAGREELRKRANTFSPLCWL